LAAWALHQDHGRQRRLTRCSRRFELLGICLVKSFNFLGFAGVSFIVYGAVAAETHQTWQPLERIANPLAAALTLVGTVLAAASIYVFSHITRPPARFSLWVSAPAVILAALVGLVILVLRGSLPTLVVNGFALLAIAGALFRMHPFRGEA
jgi:hypothetical protein